MEIQEKRKSNKIEDLSCDAVVALLEQWDMGDFVEFTKEKNLDGRKLLEVNEGIVKLWKPKSNVKKFIIFIEELKRQPEKYLVMPANSNVDDSFNAIEKTTVEVDTDCQYQTVARKKEENIAINTVNSTMNTVEELIKKLVPVKSFLYRNHQKLEKSPSYLPMDGTPKKTRRLFSLSSYEYPFFDLKARFSKQEPSTDRGYYSMKRNSRYYIQRTYKKPESKTKYKSLSTADELIEKFPEDHFYEDLCYNEVEKVEEKQDPAEKLAENQVVTVKPCMVKIQKLFQSFKVPFFKRQEIMEDKTDKIIEDKQEKNLEANENDVHLYENSDSIANNMYDSVRIPKECIENNAEKNQTKLPVEDYLEPLQLHKDYCDVSYPQRPRDDSLLGYIMSIFENRFGIRRETNDTNNSEESDTESQKADCSSVGDPATCARKWPDTKPGRTNMVDRPLPVPVENEPYYMNIDRGEAENLLTGQPDGTFVLRPSSQPNHAYTLTVSCSNAVHNVGVRRRADGRLALGFARRGERSFASVTSLLRHHRKRRLLLVAAGGIIGGTTLNETPHYYQTPSSIPVHI